MHISPLSFKLEKFYIQKTARSGIKANNRKLYVDFVQACLIKYSPTFQINFAINVIKLINKFYL